MSRIHNIMLTIQYVIAYEQEIRNGLQHIKNWTHLTNGSYVTRQLWRSIVQPQCCFSYLEDVLLSMLFLWANKSITCSLFIYIFNILCSPNVLLNICIVKQQFQCSAKCWWELLLRSVCAHAAPQMGESMQWDLSAILRNTLGVHTCMVGY